MENIDKLKTLDSENFRSPLITKVQNILSDYVKDSNHIMSRGDIDEKEKNNQISVCGFILYKNLPESINTSELIDVIGIPRSNIDKWSKNGYLSPVKKETRTILKGESFTSRPSAPSHKLMFFDKDQIIVALLLTAHEKVKEFNKKDLKKIFEERDWIFNPKNLNWISHFLINESKWKDFYNK